MNIRNRVRELRHVKASELRPNPKNWRTHPESQANALRAVLADVGFADACLARELPDGSLELVDGHLRAETAGDGDVPVLVVDLDEGEADRVLATLDPLAAMAGRDGDKLESLISGIDVDSEALQNLLEEIGGLSWLGADPVPDDSIGEYQSDSETVSVRVTVPLERAEDVVRAFEDALESLGVSATVNHL